MNTNEKLKKIYEVLDKKLAEDIIILKIDNVSTITDYFVIASAPSDRQVKSLEENVDYELSKLGEEPKSVEGRTTAKWILMDYNDVIVHIFKDDEREFYNIERLWKDALVIDPENL